MDGTILSSFYFGIQYGYGGLTWAADDNLWVANGPGVYLLMPETGDIKYSMPCPGG
jgi:hypothetical protein